MAVHKAKNISDSYWFVVPTVSSLNNSISQDKNSRRHSTSEHFLPPATPTTQEPNVLQEKQKQKDVVKRTNSDPGSQQRQR